MSFIFEVGCGSFLSGSDRDLLPDLPEALFLGVHHPFPDPVRDRFGEGVLQGSTIGFVVWPLRKRREVVREEVHKCGGGYDRAEEGIVVLVEQLEDRRLEASIFG
jgi:hypothetical protein